MHALVSDLYRTLENADELARRWQEAPNADERPATLIEAAAGRVLAGLMPSGVNDYRDCPDVTDSDLDLTQKAVLLELRGRLVNTFVVASELANHPPMNLQLRDFLERDVLPLLTAPDGMRPPNGPKEGEAENSRADAGGLVQRFRCYNCAPPHEFSACLPVCPKCGADARIESNAPYLVTLVTIHFDPLHPVLHGYGPGKYAQSGRGQGIMACTENQWPPGTTVSGETAVVTCPACRETAAFGAAEREQHPDDAADRARQRVNERVATIRVVPPPGLDGELANAFSAVATGIRECTRLMASVPHLWTDEGEYRRLAACVAEAATAASAASKAVDIRIRRAGGPNAMLEALKDVLTVQGCAPLDPTQTPGGVNAILTNLYTKRAELFPRVEGRGCIDRMLDQLARVPLATNSAPAAADPPPAVPSPLPTETQQGEGEKSKPDDKPDGPFDADGFRFAGVEVRFGRAVLQQRLVLALWDAEKQQVAPPRQVEAVMDDVYGAEHRTEDSTFRKLCSETRTRLATAGCSLAIKTPTPGVLQLFPL